MTGCVQGIRRTAGEYEGAQFDNTYIHCIVAPDNSTLCGRLTEIFKMRSLAFNHICDGYQIGVNDLINKNIRVFYDKYGRVEDFEVLSGGE